MSSAWRNAAAGRWSQAFCSMPMWRRAARARRKAERRGPSPRPREDVLHELALLRRDRGHDAGGVPARAGGVHVIGIELALLALGEERGIAGGLLDGGFQERLPARGHAGRHHENPAETLGE